MSVNIPLADRNAVRAGCGLDDGSDARRPARADRDASFTPSMSTVKVWLADARPSEAVIVKLSVVGAFSALMASLFGT